MADAELELDDILEYWKATLQYDRVVMDVSTVVLVEQTVKALEEYKGLKERK